MGHHVLELETRESGLAIVCQLHHYYQSSCNCGHQSSSQPGVGITSRIEGRSRDLKLTEYVLVGANLASFIASLPVRYRLSRVKIREFLDDWLEVSLSVGTIDRCIREAGIACEPVVEELFYGAYRHRKRRQRCLAHLIRKAIGIAESINSRTARIGALILEDLRDFIRAISDGKTKKELDTIIRSLQVECH